MRPRGEVIKGVTGIAHVDWEQKLKELDHYVCIARPYSIDTVAFHIPLFRGSSNEDSNVQGN